MHKTQQKKLHNHICYTTHFITETIGTHANFIPSKEACKLEEPDLLPSFPSLRPGDVTLHSNTDPLTNLLNYKPPLTAIDCTFISTLPTKMSAPTCLKTANNNRIKHHLHCESKKYNRPAQKVAKIMTSGESIIQELNEQNITLFPFTFDKYGSMGPLATSYFLNSDNVPSITDPKILSKLPKPALINYQKARRNTRMRSLFKSANIGWKLLNKDKWFGSTYQLTTPSNWGKHYLAMNLNIAIVKHIKKIFKIVDKSTNVQAENKK